MPWFFSLTSFLCRLEAWLNLPICQTPFASWEVCSMDTQLKRVQNSFSSQSNKISEQWSIQSYQDPFHQPKFHWVYCCTKRPSMRDLQFDISWVFLHQVCLAALLSPHYMYVLDCNRLCCSFLQTKLTCKYHIVLKANPLVNL